MKRRTAFAWALAALLAATTTHADLIVIGTATYDDGSGEGEYNLIYDSAQSIVWLDYTRPARIGGTTRTWHDHENWASGLGTSLTVNLDPLYTTTIDWTTGWRQPIVDESKANLDGVWGYAGPDETGYHDYDGGWNMVNSEMGHLYYVSLDNLGYYATDGTNPQPGHGMNNTGPFINLKEDGRYWSGTKYSLDDEKAWWQRFDGNYDGLQSYEVLSRGSYAIAVHEGRFRWFRFRVRRCWA
ncbi:hypothetical protein [Anaerobaca lacustris]|uniref:Uncharacterized protein n=1 Tax=Anaerobaca lacustris TaxID=3044600 RepID=A0AAW6TWZ2_9BACT|nr:hypothetical protein [Sedimentisphaerales bacterium M17dextr]